MVENKNNNSSWIVFVISALLFIVLSNQIVLAQKSHAKTHAKQISKEDQAIYIVQRREDVKAWLAEFTAPGKTSPATGGHPAFAVTDEDGNLYTVQVFEDMSDHTATFGYFKVNIATRKSTKL
jgi:hypothetical protein